MSDHITDEMVEAVLDAAHEIGGNLWPLEVERATMREALAAALDAMPTVDHDAFDGVVWACDCNVAPGMWHTALRVACIAEDCAGPHRVLHVGREVQP